MDDTDYDKACFVIMPFSVKAVGTSQVDFDRIYEQVFVPAVERVTLPEGGRLVPKRTDKDFFSSDISNDMFSYLEYSRVAIADISGLNANVFYEIGVRHRARESGTVILRQANAPLPFDINHIKAFPYDYEPEAKMLESRDLITRVLEQSLKMNRLNSPVQLTLKAQRADPPAVQKHLMAAENALRRENRQEAIGALSRASALVPSNAVVRVKLGLLLKEVGDWDEALIHFDAATHALDTYSDAWRERGIAENKVYWSNNRDPSLPSGEASLRRALAEHPRDYDGWASLGGVLKREGKLREALEAYAKAREVSSGHPYPLLNEIKLRASLDHELNLTEYEPFLKRAEPTLRAQTSDPKGALNAPWCFFDLSEVRLYRGDEADFLRVLEQGLTTCTAAWQPKTHRESLELLFSLKHAPQALDAAVEKLMRREQELSLK